jgi:hypothetical protein
MAWVVDASGCQHWYPQSTIDAWRDWAIGHPWWHAPARAIANAAGPCFKAAAVAGGLAALSPLAPFGGPTYPHYTGPYFPGEGYEAGPGYASYPSLAGYGPTALDLYPSSQPFLLAEGVPPTTQIPEVLLSPETSPPHQGPATPPRTPPTSTDTPNGVPPTEVPEPTTLVLLGTAVGLTILHKRRRA